MLSDIEIAASAKLKAINELAAELGIKEDELENYGPYKAKLKEELFQRVKHNKRGKLVLVTAINPTPAGEGKTTTTVGLGQALKLLDKKAIVALREPSLGPVFGMKGGAAGGGYAQALPMEDINLHFTGDIHAITAANNLLAALIDNHLQQGNKLQIDPRKIVWKRTLDMNDRALRQINIGLGGPLNGLPREDGFQITVASEIMAILCLATDLDDLKERVQKIVVAYTYDNQPIEVAQLKAAGAITALLKDAIKPNLVQSLEHSPVLIHGGPFANIAHGCNSLLATSLALKLADIVITEAGFGADLGAEKFFNIKCRAGNLKPDAVVLVATVRALKYNGGLQRQNLAEENLAALEAGLGNLEKHLENIAIFGLPCLVALNRFATDTQAEIDLVTQLCHRHGVQLALSEVFSRGGQGGLELANLLLDTLDKKANNFQYLYDLKEPFVEKLNIIAQKIYGASGVNLTDQAQKELDAIRAQGYEDLPVCMAKTQYSLSDQPHLLGRPQDFTITVRELRLAAGAGFIIAITGKILTMPGLPAKPAAELIDVEGGQIKGLF